MKKIIALILTLAMIAAMIPFAVSAADDDWSAVRVGQNRGDWLIDGDNFTARNGPPSDTDYSFPLYVLGNANDGEVTLSATFEAGKNREQGFMFGITLYPGENNPLQVYEARDHYYIVEMSSANQIIIARNEKAWDAKEIKALPEGTGEYTLSATYIKTSDSVEIVVSVNGEEFLSYKDTNPFPGVGYGLVSKTKNVAIRDVSAPDLLGSTMSQDLIKNVETTYTRITYKAGSASNGSYGIAEKFGESDMNKQFNNLFDGVNDISDYNNTNPGTRFAVRFNDKNAAITWETEKPEVASYFIIYTGRNFYPLADDGAGDRSLSSFVLYGSNDGEEWTEITSAARLHIRQAMSVFGIHLDNDTAYDHYKLSFESEQGRFESLGINLYTDTPTAESGALNGDWTVANGVYKSTTGKESDSNFSYYQLGKSTTVTLSAKVTIGKENHGFMFGAKDLNGDGKIKESDDQYYIVVFGGDGEYVKINRTNRAFGSWNKELEIKNAYNYNVGDEVTLTVSYDNGSFTVFINDEQIGEWTDTNPFTGTGYGLATKSTTFDFADIEITETIYHTPANKNSSFFYQKSNTSNSFRIIELVSEDHLTTHHDTVTITFSHATKESINVTFGANGDTVYAYYSLNASYNYLTVTYMACEGSVLIGWIITNVPEGYVPTAVTVK